ncbi:MAG: hypothetical protein J6S67_21805 [Methanobrevibacter sp.]|nr:hypothetical protein [Methanobrevibacter sp.]
MVEILNIDIPLIVGDDDYLIEDERSNSKIVVSKDEDDTDIRVKVAHCDGVATAFITKKMAVELVDILEKVIKK